MTAQSISQSCASPIGSSVGDEADTRSPSPNLRRSADDSFAYDPNQPLRDKTIGELRRTQAAGSHELESTLTAALEILDMAPLSDLSDEALDVFSKQLPKIDLHRHLEGSISPEAMWRVAQRHGLTLKNEDGEPVRNLDELRPLVQATPDTTDLLGFLQKIENAKQIFKSSELIEEITAEMVREFAADNGEYLELRFSPMFLADQTGLDLGEIARSVARGVRRATTDDGLTVRLIVLIERQRSVEAADIVRRVAARFKDQGVVAIDLANDEIHYPPGPFAPVFQKAKESDGLGIVAHCSEGTAPAENAIVCADDLRATRGGHVTNALKDPAVVQQLVERDFTVEACPTSNVQTGTIESVADYPLRACLDAGLKVVLCTDDPGTSGITASSEWAVVGVAHHLSISEVRGLLRTAARVSFLSDEERQRLVERVDDGVARAKEKMADSLTLEQLHDLVQTGLQDASVPKRVRKTFEDRYLRLLQSLAPRP